MTRDPNVFIMGEEVGQYNGAYKASRYRSGGLTSSRLLRLGATKKPLGNPLFVMYPVYRSQKGC